MWKRRADEVDRCGREGLMKWTDVEEKGDEVDRCGREGLMKWTDAEEKG